MSLVEMFIKEMDQEAKTTRKMLERVPEDKFEWRPHPKSMTMKQLATHIAELPSWTAMALNTTELDFSKMDYKPTPVNKLQELLDLFEKSLANGRSNLGKASDKDLEPNWTLRNGDQIYSVSTKAEVIRMSYCQTVHHRAQLGVYLRLLDIPIPGSYGPSADETNLTTD